MDKLVKVSSVLEVFDRISKEIEEQDPTCRGQIPTTREALASWLDRAPAVKCKSLLDLGFRETAKNLYKKKTAGVAFMEEGPLMIEDVSGSLVCVSDDFILAVAREIYNRRHPE